MSRSRRRRSGGARQMWRRWLTEDMRRARQHCRGCGLVTGHITQVPGGLRFGHIRAAALGGGPEIANTTIVCGGCDSVMGPRDWSGLFTPLCDEPWWPAVAAEIACAIRHRPARR